MNYKIPRLLISAPKSGSGKTIFTAALAKALIDRGISLSMFKCGPDYVDPMLHKEITGKSGSNLDLFFNDEELLKRRFFEKASQSELALIEGAMGFYDGMGGITEINSAFHISEVLSCPAVLIVDAEGSSFSLCALISGFLNFRKNNIKGIILNKCSKSLFSILKPVIEKECGTLVLGFIPKDEKLRIRNVKLGLLLDDKENLREVLARLSYLISENVDLDKLLEIAKDAPDVTLSDDSRSRENLDLNVSIARDEAFSFIYEDNIEFLKENGCNTAFFSPLKDNRLPYNTDVCIFPGGYIENNAEKLSKNGPMLSAVRSFYEKGGFIIAEGSGFIYLNKGLKDDTGKLIPLCGILSGNCKKEEKLTNFGYINLFDESENPILKAHEFHYSSSSDDGDSFIAKRFRSKRSRKTIFRTSQLFCGFPQFDYKANEAFFTELLKNIKKK